jgi:hypothetical protein
VSVLSPDSIDAGSQWLVLVLPAAASGVERVVRASVDGDDSDGGDADVADGAGDDGDDDTDEDGGSGRSTVWAEAKTHTVDQTGMQACVAMHRIPHCLDLDGCCLDSECTTTQMMLLQTCWISEQPHVASSRNHPVTSYPNVAKQRAAVDWTPAVPLSDEGGVRCMHPLASDSCCCESALSDSVDRS